MATKTQGTAFIHGVDGTVSGITVQSYTISTSHANADEVVNSQGIVVGVRYSDVRHNLSVEGLVATGYSGTIGNALTFSGMAGLDFDGHILTIEERGEAKGYVRISLTAIQYEGISSN